MKTLKTFRLSDRSLEYLERLHAETGASVTAILEMAIASFYRRFFTDNTDEATFGEIGGVLVSDEVGDLSMSDDARRVAHKQLLDQQTRRERKAKKKRKRH